MEAQEYLSEEHKKVVEEVFGTINDKLCRLQEDALNFTFPSHVSGNLHAAYMHAIKCYLLTVINCNSNFY